MYRSSVGDDLQFDQSMTSRYPTPPAAPASSGQRGPIVHEPTATDSPADKILRMATALPCGHAATEGGVQCLDANWITNVGACKFGLPAPAGVKSGVWKAFCLHVGGCNTDTLPGCASYDASLATTVPSCLDDATASTLSYCDQYPTGNGPDPSLNALCWAANKSPTYMYNLHATPRCGGGSVAPAPVASAGMSPLVKWGLIGGAALGVLYFVTKKR